MKKLLLFLTLICFFFACSKTEVSPDLQVNEFSARQSNCAKSIKKVQKDMTGCDTKAWLVFYYLESGELVQHPLIDNVNGTVYVYTKVTDSHGLVREFTGGDTIQMFNYGTYDIGDCGNALFVNTQIFTNDFRVDITKSNPEKFETHINAPLGTNGEIIVILGKGRPWNK